jgi:hypothetical protein
MRDRDEAERQIVELEKEVQQLKANLASSRAAMAEVQGENRALLASGWKSTDPRIDVYKTAIIVVLRPTADGIESVCGTCETKHAYYVHLGARPGRRSLDERDTISEGDDWPEDWWWIRAPAGTNWATPPGAG